MRSTLKTILVSVLFSIIACLATMVIYAKLFFKNSSVQNYGVVPNNCWPQFDDDSPYTINGPLWVGFDSNKGCWRYLKIPKNEPAGELQRGIKDPGDPTFWDNNMGITGYFDGRIDALPSGTHINNRFVPHTMSSKYNVDDYMVKVGNFWVDKYESSIVIISSTNDTSWIDDPPYGGLDKNAGNSSGSAINFPPNAIAVSQRRKPTSGITYFSAEQSAINNGKHLIRNEQWQAASSGTLRTNADGMESGGNSWGSIEDQDISRYGIVGCAGSLWEWTSSWGQYGEHYEGLPTNWYDWPGPDSYAEWDATYSSYGDDIIINVAGRAYTRQDSARYAPGLPAALVRGGSWGDHNRAGIFAIIADGAPSYYGFEVGFRCIK